MGLSDFFLHITRIRRVRDWGKVKVELERTRNESGEVALCRGQSQLQFQSKA